ncbi:hypothetical protein RJD39_00740 [Vibrio scophthalmi]|uniref:hypothetical protein n=1 Tax=Vibrio scophthalmi TaxID=45658 RepID=UPI003873811D
MSKKDERPVIIIQADLTPISLKEYAARYGEPLTAVRKQAYDQAIPTIQMGKSTKVYVNIAQMVTSSLSAAGWDVQVPKPYMS